MDVVRSLELPSLQLNLGSRGKGDGGLVLRALLELAAAAINELQRANSNPTAIVGRLRGTGRGIHFSKLIDVLERDHPIELRSPFEASHLVAGAAWDSRTILGPGIDAALAKLRWSAGADDLPMHVHEQSDRFIIVHEGRGFFHVSNQSVDNFDGSDVRTIPARERDVFLFTRGVVHTFSTLHKPMTLLSCQLPFLPFDDPRQYRLPKHIWTARDNPEPKPPTVGCDPAWTVLARQSPAAANAKQTSVLTQILAMTPML